MRRILVVLCAVTLVATGAAPAAAKRPPPEPVSVVGPWWPDSPEGEAFTAELDAFAGKKFEIAYDNYFDTADLLARVNGDDPPDVVIVGQPAVLGEMAESLTDMSEFVNPRSLRRDFGDYLIDVATFDEAILGAPIKVDLKSLVWYEPAAFDASGYAVPETFDELVALSDGMVADGLVPWCNYIESGFATGWMGTDWIEDFILGTDGPEVYDQWVDHDVLFQDLRVEDAFERFMQMVDSAGYVFDRINMLNVDFFSNAEPLGAGDCMMHKQATFFASAIDLAGLDLNEFATFKFPSVDPDYSESAIGGGVYAAALSNNKHVRKVMRFLVGKRFGQTALAASGSWLLPNIRFNPALYPTDLTRAWAEDVEAAIRAGVFRVDGSDLMPPEVSAGTFWAGVVDLVSGAKKIPSVLSEIDDSWPS